ncbi:MAG: ABC transporter ATP-binding protein [Synechococcus sp.]
MLQIDNISKSFSGFHALEGCSFEIGAGEIVGLIGPNGAGKTTLFNVISGFIKPENGWILFDRQDVTGWSPHRLFQQGLVRTFQIPREFGRMTVLENLMLIPSKQVGENLLSSCLQWKKVKDREREVMAKAEAVLENLNLTHLRSELAKNLSGGQKKLLELGRTMMVTPKVVLLDEPGAGVNRTLLRQLSGVVKQLNAERGLTFCIIEHDLDLVARLCDRVIVLAEGKVLALGTMEEIRSNDAVRNAYLGMSHLSDAQLLD